MKWPWLILCVVLFYLGSAFAPAPTPTPLPPSTPELGQTPIVAPVALTPAPASSPTPGAGAAYFPSDMPACKDFKIVGQRPHQFDWPDIDKVGENAEWLTVRCSDKPANLAAFYQQKMIVPPFNWQEMAWVDLPQGSLGVYFHAGYQSWKYLWFLADTSSPDATQLVIANQLELPMDLTCCH